MRRLFFDHVPKCGGLAFRAFLERAYGPSSVTPQGGYVSYRMALQQYNGYDAIALHIRHDPLEEFVRDRHHMTVLRDPLTRVLSHIQFAARDIETLGHGFVQKCRALGVEGVLLSDDQDVLEFTSNLMTKHFCQITWDGRSAMDDATRLDNAKTALERYDLVGVQEELDDCAATLACQIGAQAEHRLEIVNATTAKSTSLSSQAARRLADLNTLDMELWLHAKKLFREQRFRTLVNLSGRAPHRDVPAPPAEPSDTKALAPEPVRYGTREIEFYSASAVGEISSSPAVLCGDNLLVRLPLRSHIDEPDATVGLSIWNGRGEHLFGTNTRLLGYRLSFRANRSYHVEFLFPNQLSQGEYFVDASIHRGASHLLAAYDIWERAAKFAVVGNLGLHFEGAVKLYPTVSVASPDESGTSWISDGHHEHQRIGVLNPELKDVYYELEIADAPAEVRAREVFVVPMTLRNLGNEPIPGIGMHAAYVAYHWRTPEGETAQYDGARTSFARVLGPGEFCLVHAKVVAPPAPGRYLLEPALVQEGKRWFDLPDGPRTEISVISPDSLAA